MRCPRLQSRGVGALFPPSPICPSRGQDSTLDTILVSTLLVLRCILCSGSAVDVKDSSWQGRTGQATTGQDRTGPDLERREAHTNGHDQYLRAGYQDKGRPAVEEEENVVRLT